MGVHILSSISPVLTTNYWAFTACQTLQASTMPAFVFVLLILGKFLEGKEGVFEDLTCCSLLVCFEAIENVPPQHRSTMFAYLGLAFHLGEWTMFVLIKLLAHWVWITMVKAGFGVVCIIVFMLVNTKGRRYLESPHFALANKDSGELKKILVRINRENGVELDGGTINSIVGVSILFCENPGILLNFWYPHRNFPSSTILKRKKNKSESEREDRLPPLWNKQK